MSVRKVKAKLESKEERVALISLKQGVIVAFITVVFTFITSICVAYINKPVLSKGAETNDLKLKLDSGVKYFQNKIDIAETELKSKGKSLENNQKIINNLLLIEKDPAKIEVLRKTKAEVDKAVKVNQMIFDNEVSRKVLEPLKEGDIPSFELRRTEVNKELKKEYQARKSANISTEQLKPYFEHRFNFGGSFNQLNIFNPGSSGSSIINGQTLEIDDGEIQDIKTSRTSASQKFLLKSAESEQQMQENNGIQYREVRFGFRLRF